MADLEGLHELVSGLLVDRRLVGDEHPVGALEVLHVEDLGVEVGRVVDDDQHLGLRVEVRAGTDDDVLEVELSGVGHGLSLSVQLAQTALDLGVDVERLQAGPRAAAVTRLDERAHLVA